MLSKHIQTIITPDQTPKNNEFIHTIQVLTPKVEIGMGENQFTPGELLQLALATCHTFSADHVFSAALGKDFAASVGVASQKDERRDSYSHLTVEMVADLAELSEEQVKQLRQKSQAAIDKYCTVGHTLEDGASYDFDLVSE